MNEVARFLGSYPPFEGLEPEDLQEAAGSVRVAFFPTGATILRQGGEPSDALYVVRTGSVALLDGDRVVDLLEEGELFGHPSLLTGLAPAFTARSHEDALCYLIPGEVADEVFGSSSGIGFLAASLRGRGEAAARSHIATADARLTRVETIASRPALMCPPTTTVREVAELMTRAGATAALVVDGAVHGIVTDSDLRAKVLAGGLDPATPVGVVMTAPVRSIEGDALAHEALLEMLDRGLHHLPVTEGERIIGLVSDLDLLGLERRDPFTLRTEVERAGSWEEVAAVGRRLPAALVALAGAGVPAEDLGRVTSTLVDAMTARLLQLVTEELGEPSFGWGWLALGSEGRREQSLVTDQDHLLVVEDGADPHDPAVVAIVERVTQGLEAAGLRRCPSDVMATTPAWRNTVTGWAETFEAWMTAPDTRAAFVTTIAFDYRYVAGELDPTPALDRVVRTARERPAFLWRCAKLALQLRPPLGLWGGVVARGDGRLDVKEGGLLPVVDLARLAALRAGVAEPRTSVRLRTAPSSDGLPAELADALLMSFRFLSDLRIAHQVARIREGEEPDNLLDPRELGPIDRGGLRDAFRTIAHVQDEVRGDLAGPRVR